MTNNPTEAIMPQAQEITSRWPHIKRFLCVEPGGWIADDFQSWCTIEKSLNPVDRVAANEGRLLRVATGAAGHRTGPQPNKAPPLTEWTDSMAYCCRRSAAWARGEDSGVWVSQSWRRPDLTEEYRAIIGNLTTL
jgi:hypothetical protein